MSHVPFLPMTGFQVQEIQMRQLGMSLLRLAARANALAQLRPLVS